MVMLSLPSKMKILSLLAKKSNFYTFDSNIAKKPKTILTQKKTKNI